MKKLKNILNRFTWIDFVIVVCVICAVIFAFSHIGSDDNKEESVSFDSSTMNKFGEKYLSFYDEGKIIKTHLGGYNSSSGEYIEVYGRVLWVCKYKEADVHVLIDVDGQPIVAGLHKEVSDADVYIEHITLETSGEKYPNLIEIKAQPKNISYLTDIDEGISENINYTIDTKIAIDSKTSQQYQELFNELYSKFRKDSIRTFTDDSDDYISVIMATNNELDIGSKILGNLNGQTDIITIRIYNSNAKDIEAFKENFDIISIRHVS